MSRLASSSLKSDGAHTWHLKGFDLFHGLSDGEIAGVEQKSQLRSLRRGEILYLTGDPADRVYTIRQGLVRLTALTAEGREATLAILGDGEILGELEVIEGTTRTHVATAHQESLVFAIPKDVFLDLMVRQRDFAFHVTVRLGQKIAQFQSKIACLLFKGAHSRLSELLLEFSERFGQKTPEGTRLRYRFSHRELANLIGVSRETVSYTIGEFRRSGLISTHGGHIVLRRPGELAARR
jgi:CRP-like cAMP-binding protein